MDISIIVFIEQMLKQPELFFTAVLTFAVFFVNGLTGTSNSISTSVATRAIAIEKAIALASVMNFLGVFLMTLINPTVAHTIYRMVDLGGNARDGLLTLLAAMIAIVSWSFLAWKAGVPTSDSHALIAGITGAAIAMQNGLGGINASEWIKVVYGFILSILLGTGLGYLFTKSIQIFFRDIRQRKLTPFLKRAQILGSGAVAFMRGAQDGQKFLGVFMLGVFLSQGDANLTDFTVPVWIIFVFAIVMAIGTSLGGVRVIKTVGMDMVELKPYQGFSTDAATSFTLLLSSFLGFPVSTTHTKTTAIIGSGMVKGLKFIDWRVVKNLVYAWLLTFPGCGLLGFIIAKIFLKLF